MDLQFSLSNLWARFLDAERSVGTMVIYFINLTSLQGGAQPSLSDDFGSDRKSPVLGSAESRRRRRRRGRRPLRQSANPTLASPSPSWDGGCAAGKGSHFH